MKFHFIATEKAHHSLDLLCRCLRVTRSGFYAWATRGLSARAQHSGHGEVSIPERPYIEKLRVNKDGQVKLSKDARVGSAVLKRGRYVFEHIDEGEGHFIAFKRVDVSGVEAREQVIRVKCRLEPLNKPAKLGSTLEIDYGT